MQMGSLRFPSFNSIGQCHFETHAAFNKRRAAASQRPNTSMVRVLFEFRCELNEFDPGRI